MLQEAQLFANDEIKCKFITQAGQIKRLENNSFNFRFSPDRTWRTS
jgi:hypothetical protein